MEGKMIQRTNGNNPKYLTCDICKKKKLVISIDKGYFGTTYNDGWREERYQAELSCGHMCDCQTTRSEYSIHGKFNGLREYINYFSYTKESAAERVHYLNGGK
jgi:hypothetical protein